MQATGRGQLAAAVPWVRIIGRVGRASARLVLVGRRVERSVHSATACGRPSAAGTVELWRAAARGTDNWWGWRLRCG
jgi:hypothetical protein